MVDLTRKVVEPKLVVRTKRGNRVVSYRVKWIELHWSALEWNWIENLALGIGNVSQYIKIHLNNSLFDILFKLYKIIATRRRSVRIWMTFKTFALLCLCYVIIIYFVPFWLYTMSSAISILIEWLAFAKKIISEEEKKNVVGTIPVRWLLTKSSIDI